jgi:ComF family protein
MRLLRVLFDLVFPERAAQALVSEATPEILGTLVQPVHVQPDTVALLPYRAPLVRACITETKFSDSQKAAALLAGVLTEYLKTLKAEAIVLVPVPLSKKRMKERGYNQVERVARLALPSLERAELVTDLLVRVRDTLPQTSLAGTARRDNLKGAFAVTGSFDPHHTYIVLDDVLTTGSTMQAVLGTLREAGMYSASGLSLAH